MDRRIHPLAPAFLKDTIKPGQQDEIEGFLFIGKHVKNGSPQILDHLAGLAQTQRGILVKNTCRQVDQKAQTTHFLFFFFDESLLLLIRTPFFFHTL